MTSSINNLCLFMGLEQDKRSKTFRRPLAKCVLVFLIRGLFTHLKFPYAHFPTASTTGADLFPKVISRLTRLGLHIMTVTCDGARLLFSLHDEKMTKRHTTSRMFTPNAGHPIFFISDQSHLIKAIQNCFLRRKLWVHF